MARVVSLFAKRNAQCAISRNQEPNFLPAEMEVELVKVEVDVVGEAEASDDAQREEGDWHPPLGQPARPADQARGAAAELDQFGVLDVEQWCLQEEFSNASSPF